MKSFVALFAVLAVGSVIATAAVAAAPRHASVVIRHEVKHCHSWALGSGPSVAHVNAKLAVGGSITFKNTDVMPHRLIEKSGPHAIFAGSASMSHMAASVKVTFPRAGTYRFTTKAGEDYMTGVKTIGEDNVLTLTVTVS
jgi:plastocyanin